jgi:hypothetical protein
MASIGGSYRTPAPVMVEPRREREAHAVLIEVRYRRPLLGSENVKTALPHSRIEASATFGPRMAPKWLCG